MLKVNLQPKITLEAKEGFRMSWWFSIILFVFVGAAVGGTYWMTQQDILDKEAEIKQLDFKLRDFQEIISNYERAANEKEYLKGKRDFVQGISENQKQWIDFFDQLKEKTPKDVWYTRFSGNRTGSYDVEGNTFTFASVGFLMLQINSITHVNSVVLSTASGQTSRESGKNPMEAITKKFKISGSMTLLSKKDETAGGTPGAAPSGGAPGAAAPPAQGTL